MCKVILDTFFASINYIEQYNVIIVYILIKYFIIYSWNKTRLDAFLFMWTESHDSLAIVRFFVVVVVVV